LVLGVLCVVLDTARHRRPGAAWREVLREVGHRPSDWQLVTGGLGFVGAAFAARLTPWAALLGLVVAAFVTVFLHTSRPRRAKVPLPAEVPATPEPASNMKILA
jgi:hypothetical protein